MEIVLKDKKENDLLKRTEILAIIKSEITPKMQDATKALAEYLHVDAELMTIKRMKGKFGRHEFEVEACVYETREAMQRIEPKPKAKKEGEEKAKQEGKQEVEEKPIKKEGKKPDEEKEKTPQAEKKAEQGKPEKKKEEEQEKKEEKTEPTAK